MKPRFAILCLAALALYLQALPAGAGVIELSVSVIPNPTKQGLELTIRLANQGDEAAEDIGLEAVLPGMGSAKLLPGPSLLKPGTDKLIHTSLRQREHGPGLHPVILKVRYHDANQYPFSTLTYGLYQVGTPVKPVVLIRGIPSAVTESGRAAFALANLSPDPLAVSISFFAPDELYLSDTSLKTRIASDGKKIIEAGLENRSALAGAFYPAVALVRYKWRGQTLTAPASAQVKIELERDAPPVWWVWAALLVIFAGLSLVMGLRSKGSPPNLRNRGGR